MTVPEAIDRVSDTVGRIKETLRVMLAEAQDPERPPMALAMTVRRHGGSHNYTATVTFTGLARVTVEVNGLMVQECQGSPCVVPLTIRAHGMATVAALGFDTQGVLRAAVLEPVSR